MPKAVKHPAAWMLFFQKNIFWETKFVTNRLAAHLTDHSNDSMKLFPVWPQTPAEPVQTWKPKHSTDSVYLMDFSFTDLGGLRAFGASNLFIFICWIHRSDNLVTILHHNIHFVSPLIFKSLDISRRMINIGIELVTLSFASHPRPKYHFIATLLSEPRQCGRYCPDCTLVHTGERAPGSQSQTSQQPGHNMIPRTQTFTG